MKRKFTTQVSMPLVAGVWNEEHSQAMIDLGYSFIAASPVGLNCGISTYTRDEKPEVGMYFNLTYEDKSERVFLTECIPELFIAIAAMSEGDHFYTGEHVVYNDDYILKIEEENTTSFTVLTRKGNVYKDRCRKTTVEEIIPYFTLSVPAEKEREFLDYPINEGDFFKNVKNGVLYEVTGKVTNATNGFEGQHLIVYTDKTSTYVRDVGEFRVKFEKVHPLLKRLPVAGEEIYVWNGDALGIRRKRTFGGFEGALIVAYSINMDRTVSGGLWENYALTDQQQEIRMEDVLTKVSKLVDVPATNLKIV